jgi:hypothetical protein
MDLQEVNVGIQTASGWKDRNRWWALVSAVMNILVP